MLDETMSSETMVPKAIKKINSPFMPSRRSGKYDIHKTKQYKTTRVQHDTTRVQHKTTRVQHQYKTTSNLF